MYLGIEIGGTKLQLAVGAGDGSTFAALERENINSSRGAAAILNQIEEIATALLKVHRVSAIGIGFGGPVDVSTGSTITSHQVPGWDGVPLVSWCQDRMKIPTVLGNDCDAAALAEARYGAGKQKRSVFYVTVGTGVGGGFVYDGLPYGAGRPAVAEIGHLRPGMEATQRDATVESVASGPSIASWVKERISGAQDSADVADLLRRIEGDRDGLTTKIVGAAAADGNRVAAAGLKRASNCLGWGIAQVITLLAPEVVIVGGGVSLIGEQLFFQPLREAIATYVFPPLTDTYEVAAASLGESVVVHGAIAMAIASHGEPAP